MSIINIDELNSIQQSKKKYKEEIYETILLKCHCRIKLSAKTNDFGCCFYSIPKYIYGMPIYDYKLCLIYIVKALTKNGFSLKYTHPNLLFISWKGKKNPENYKSIENTSNGFRPIEEYKSNKNLVYNSNLLKSLDNKIKIFKNS